MCRDQRYCGGKKKKRTYSRKAGRVSPDLTLTSEARSLKSEETGHAADQDEIEHANQEEQQEGRSRKRLT